MKPTDLDSFTRGYLETALFTTHPPSGCDYVESGRADEMFPLLPAEFIADAKRDCEKFKTENAALLEQAGDDWQNGCDFWYTRNGHGCGFWDRGYPDEVADPLKAACKAFGEYYGRDGFDQTYLTAALIARKFSELLRLYISESGIRAIIERNKTPEYKDCCASHDFCDSNVFMTEAFEEVTKEEFEPQDTDQADLWNEAWRIAKEKEFTF